MNNASPYTPRPIILVAAGNYNEFKTFLRDAQLGNTKAIYISKEEQLFLYRNCDLYRYGTWYLHPLATGSQFFDLPELNTFASRQANVFDGLPQKD
jgi:hypothetical protein